MNQKEGDLNQAIAYMMKHKALEKTLESAGTYAREAQNQLQIFPLTPVREALEELTCFVVSQAL